MSPSSRSIYLPESVLANGLWRFLPIFPSSKEDDHISARPWAVHYFKLEDENL